MKGVCLVLLGPKYSGLLISATPMMKLFSCKVEGGEVLHTLQGQVGHAADKSLLPGQILFLGGLVLLHNGVEPIIQFSIRENVTSLLLDELVRLTRIIP